MHIAISLPRLKTHKSGNVVPTTARGRALFSVDWFLNGRPVLRNHDNPCLSLRNGLSC